MTKNETFGNKEALNELEKKLSQIRTGETKTKYEELAKQSGLPFLDLKKIPISTDAIKVLDESMAKESGTVVISKKGFQIILATADPEDENVKKTIESLESRNFVVKIIIATPEDIREILKRYDALPHKDSVELGAIELNDEELAKLEIQIKDIDDLKQKIRTVAVTKILDILIAGALKTQASDIHFEPGKEQTKIRYRFDGILHDISTIDRDYYDKIVNRVKIISNMKINIRSAPQDGRFTIRQKSVDIEVRTSVLPSEFGETIVLRLLDPRLMRQSLGELGVRPDLLSVINMQLARPNGAIITTGPTGSGKTTALYSFLTMLATPDSKVITIEDPIEYHIDGISQTQVDASKGYTFANGLRAIVRQDPDVILVGEIRDQETADIALNASLTGHLVLSTLHTNDAAGAIPRLIDLGIRPEIIAPAINMALAQRLLRKLCPSCKKESKIPTEKISKIKDSLEPIKTKFGLPDINKDTKVFVPTGCNECNNSGYKGRIGTFEGFVVSKELEELILGTPTISAIRELATKQGMISMLQDSYMKLLEGTTSLEEIERVVG